VQVSLAFCSFFEEFCVLRRVFKSRKGRDLVSLVIFKPYPTASARLVVRQLPPHSSDLILSAPPHSWAQKGTCLAFIDKIIWKSIILTTITMSRDCAFESPLSECDRSPQPPDFCQTPPERLCAPSRQLYQSQLIPNIQRVPTVAALVTQQVS
jgi:hypothetical protein